MTSRIKNNGAGRNGFDEGNDIMNTVFQESKDLKFADIFGKLVKKTDDGTQASL